MIQKSEKKVCHQRKTMFQWEKEHLKGVRYNADQYPDDQFLYWGNDWRLVYNRARRKMT